MLTPVGDNFWIAEGPVVDFHSFPYPTRMAVARLSNGDLWIWSPIPLEPALRQAVEGLGAPAHLVSPNKIHHLFLGAWAEVYPTAKIWGLQSVIRKRPDLHFADPLGDRPPDVWRDEIDQVVFRGSPIMDEIVFFHRPSRTAIFADLIENFSLDFLRETPGWQGWRAPLARLLGITEPFGMAPLDWRLSFVHRKPARAALERVLAWDPQQVVMAHGRCAHDNGRAFVRRCFRWLMR